MRKTISLSVVVMLLTASVVFAEEMKGGMMGGDMMGQGMMHGMMGKASMVSSNDGGVIVIIGNKLYKYDKNLMLVKQIELPIEKPEMNMVGKKEMTMTEKKGCSCGAMGACGGK